MRVRRTVVLCLALLIGLAAMAIAVPTMLVLEARNPAPNGAFFKIFAGGGEANPHQLVFQDGHDGTILATLGDNKTTADFSLLRSTGTFSGQEISFGGINPGEGNAFPYVERSGGTDGMNLFVPEGSQYAWRFITRVNDENVTVRAQVDRDGNGWFHSVQPDGARGGFAADVFPNGKSSSHPHEVAGSCSSIEATGTTCAFENGFAFQDADFTCQITARGSAPAYFSYASKTPTGFKAYSNAGHPSADYRCIH